MSSPIATIADQSQVTHSDDPQLAANKQLIFDFWINVFQPFDMTDAAKYMPEDYVQHNPNVGSGRQAFLDFFSKFPKQEKKSAIDNLVSLVAEGDKVILARKRTFPDPDNAGSTYETTWFDMFRIEDGLIVEHWDYGTIQAN